MPAPFDVQAFKAALGAGGARPNQFMVNITRNGGGMLPPIASYLVTAASLPGQVLNPAVVMYRGREVKMAGDRVFAPWTTTFLNDTAMIARDYVETWMNDMESREFKVGQIVPDAYYGVINATQLDRNGGEIRTYTFTDVMPIDISEVQLDYGANDQVSTFTVTWVYQQFAILPGAVNVGGPNGLNP